MYQLDVSGPNGPDPRHHSRDEGTTKARRRHDATRWRGSYWPTAAAAAARLPYTRATHLHLGADYHHSAKLSEVWERKKQQQQDGASPPVTQTHFGGVGAREASFQ